ncbi:MAG: hypothetical protein WBA37_11830 [Xanthobacteraceae bacterium]
MLSWNPLLKPSGGGFAPFIKTLGGGPALNSDWEQVVPQQAQRWRANVRLSVNTTEQIFALREMIFGLEGRANTIAVPAFDRARSPWAVDQWGRTLGPKFMRRQTLDGTPFADPANFVDSLITARVDLDTALRASQVIVNITKGGAPTVGMYFSIGTRLHMIKKIDGVDGKRYALNIWPLLRADVVRGTPVNFTSPVCEMRFQTDDQGQDILSALDLFKFGAGTLAFEEVPAT